MKEPTVTVPMWFANFNMPIIARGTTEGGSTPVGAGPFVLKGQERGVAIDLEAFDRFFKPGLPKVKSIRFVAYADENLRVAALQAGDVDIIDYVPWQAMDAIERDSKLKLLTTNGPFMGLIFNGRTGPFTDARVQAGRRLRDPARRDRQGCLLRTWGAPRGNPAHAGHSLLRRSAKPPLAL